MLRSALLILSGNAFASLLQLARNLIVARMISVADYGVASTFIVALAVVEMASALGLQHQIVQAKEGEDPRFQAALQGFQVLRGVLSGVIFFLVAEPMADFMGIPEVTWAYRLLALVPVLNALVHFDIYRLNRQMVFWPMLLTGVLPALLSLLVLWPLVHWFDDWRVMPFSILLQAVLAVIVSHALGRQPYRLVLDRAVIAQSLRFGWPILANAVLLFFVFHGDRLIVARISGMEPLAIFSMGVTLTLAPTMVASQSLRNFFLPQLSKGNDAASSARSAEFYHMARVTLQASVLVSALLLALMVAFAAPVVHVLLGQKYEALIPLLVPLAALGGIRVCKSGPAVVALAAGRTGNSMVANLPRVLALPLAWYLLHTGGGLLQLIWLGIAAELLGYGLGLMLIRRIGVGVLPGANALFLTYTVAVVVASLAAAAESVLASWQVALVAFLFLPLLVLAMPELRHYASRHGLRRR